MMVELLHFLLWFDRKISCLASDFRKEKYIYDIYKSQNIFSDLVYIVAEYKTVVFVSPVIKKE